MQSGGRREFVRQLHYHLSLSQLDLHYPLYLENIRQVLELLHRDQGAKLFLVVNAHCIVHGEENGGRNESAIYFVPPRVYYFSSCSMVNTK